MRAIAVSVVLCLSAFALAACEAESGFVFPGWDAIHADEASAYCADRGAVVVPIPTTDREVAEAAEACRIADDTKLCEPVAGETTWCLTPGEIAVCWVGAPTETATFVTIYGDIVSVASGARRALALCRAR